MKTKIKIRDMFGATFVHKGNINMNVRILVPFLLYISTSVITNAHNGPGGAILYSLHLTPFIAIGFAWRQNGKT